jgi:hypothetical protein
MHWLAGSINHKKHDMIWDPGWVLSEVNSHLSTKQNKSRNKKKKNDMRFLG